MIQFRGIPADIQMMKRRTLLFFSLLLMLAGPSAPLQAKTDVFKNNGYLQKSSPYFNRPSPYFRTPQDKSWLGRTMDSLRETFQNLTS